jgi:putative endonuclease
MYTLYILRFHNNSLYIGQTNNLIRRLQEHKNGSAWSAKFVKENGPFELVYIEEYQTRLESMRRELQLKKWSRVKKDALINGDIDLLKRL